MQDIHVVILEFTLCYIMFEKRTRTYPQGCIPCSHNYHSINRALLKMH